MAGEAYPLMALRGVHVMMAAAALGLHQWLLHVAAAISCAPFWPSSMRPL